MDDMLSEFNEEYDKFLDMITDFVKDNVIDAPEEKGDDGESLQDKK